jgi:hypothetical protein
MVDLRPRAVRTPTPVVTSAPDRRGRLSNGAAVEASIRARLLGIPLLKLDATIVILPAEATAPSTAPHESAGTRSFGIRSTSSGAAGRGLAEAVQSINEGEKVLAEMRRNGS